MNLYFNRMKSKHIFIFLSAYFILCFVYFFYDQYTCIFTVKIKKMNPYFKKMK